ncbi:AMP-binding protein [Catellatospora bangladeshensis]|uniref:AMP-binding protein n=1 Tax=Catellatospora bangladeshensis TaxID=310355 RepID=UPI0036110E2D
MSSPVSACPWPSRRPDRTRRPARRQRLQPASTTRRTCSTRPGPPASPRAWWSPANIRHYTESLLDRLAITEPLAYAHVTTLAADLGNTCVFLALWTGGTLHLVDDATRRDPQALRRYLRAERIDVLKTTPSHWAAVLPGFDDDAQAGPALRMLVLGGELLSLPLARRVLASGTARTLVNHYGPTETTVGVACHVLDSPAHVDGLGDAASVPIGRPLGANRLFVRTADGRFRERDATGELYVAGPSVALGYRGDDAATAAAFTRDLEQAHPGAGRAYRTGDRVRISADGVLEFLGRGDRQVKIKGYRVELGHVENGLRRLPAVADAVVVHRADRRPALVAAVVTDSRRHGPRPDVHRQLRQVLPPYLVPDRIEFFDAFPRNDNGKTDHGTLRELIETRLARGAARPPRHRPTRSSPTSAPPGSGRWATRRSARTTTSPPPAATPSTPSR